VDLEVQVVGEVLAVLEVVEDLEVLEVVVPMGLEEDLALQEVEEVLLA
jgi:hypothetical protein